MITFQLVLDFNDLKPKVGKSIQQLYILFCYFICIVNNFLVCFRAVFCIVNHHMDMMRELDLRAYHWLENLDPKTWVRAFLSEFPK